MLQHLTWCFLLKGIFFENEWVFLLIGTITNFKSIQQQSLSRRYWYRKIFVAKGGCDIFKGVWHRNIYHSGLIFRCACLPSLAGWSDWQGRLHLAFAHWIPRLKACNIKEKRFPGFSNHPEGVAQTENRQFSSSPSGWWSVPWGFVVSTGAARRFWLYQPFRLLKDETFNKLAGWILKTPATFQIRWPPPGWKPATSKKTVPRIFKSPWRGGTNWKPRFLFIQSIQKKGLKPLKLMGEIILTPTWRSGLWNRVTINI